jgi:hypothetical protein
MRDIGRPDILPTRKGDFREGTEVEMKEKVNDLYMFNLSTQCKQYHENILQIQHHYDNHFLFFLLNLSPLMSMKAFPLEDRAHGNITRKIEAPLISFETSTLPPPPTSL